MGASTRVCSCCAQALSCCVATPPQKSLCISLRGLTGSGCSPTWASLWLVGRLHPLPPLLWERCLQPLPSPPTGATRGAQMSRPKAPSFGEDRPWGHPFLQHRLTVPTLVSAVPCPGHWPWAPGSQANAFTRAGGLPWGCGQGGACPQLLFAPFPAGPSSGAAVSVRRR